ncbi:unnamed protein product [Dicrocoelium dendriticum]|nr:unnamed protein product [Dicrocoelium dendriticum]
MTSPNIITPELISLIEYATEHSHGDSTAIQMQSLHVRGYLEKTLVPLLILGLQTLAKERPSKPIEYLAAFLMKNKNFGTCKTRCTTEKCNA